MLAPALTEILTLPRGLQLAALQQLRARLPSTPAPEAWNSRFGPDSLFGAWTATSLMNGLYVANMQALAPFLAKPGFSVLEVGGGDGSLWRRALGPACQGQLWVIDPVAEVEEELRSVLPEGVELHFIRGRAEHALDQVQDGLDAIVCSLTLHHIAGADCSERATAGLSGPGKKEVLTALGGLLSEGGRVIINEADVHCDLELLPGDPMLRERMLDSYVRRCAPAVLQDIATRTDADDDLRARWTAVVLHWCIEQVDLADSAIEARDVYELDAPRWRKVFSRAGLDLLSEVPTDNAGLFRQYILAPSQTHLNQTHRKSPS